MPVSTLFVAQVVSFITITILLCLVARLRFPFPGPGWWAGAYITAALGSVLLALRGIVPDVLVIVLGNTLNIASLFLVWNGLRLFLDKPGFSPGQWRLQALFFAAIAGALYWLSAVHDDIHLRIVLCTLSLAIPMVLTWKDMADMVRKYRALLLLHRLYFLCCIILFARTIFFILFLSGKVQKGFVDTIFLLAVYMCTIAYAFSFIMLISERLLQTLGSQYKMLEKNMKFRQEMEDLLYHDLKSPMLPVAYLPDVLLKSEELSEKGKSRVLQIKEAAQRILNLISEALSVHSTEVEMKIKSMAPVNFIELLHKVNSDLISLQKENGVNVALLSDTTPAASDRTTIQGDESQLYRMCSNLLQNAVQASPNNATVCVRLLPEQDRLHLEIRNKGEVPEALRSRFFEKYSRSRDSKGLGLGTYSARLAVQAHGGDIALNTDEPGVTHVNVWLPYVQG